MREELHKRGTWTLRVGRVSSHVSSEPPAGRGSARDTIMSSWMPFLLAIAVSRGATDREPERNLVFAVVLCGACALCGGGVWTLWWLGVVCAPQFVFCANILCI